MDDLEKKHGSNAQLMPTYKSQASLHTQSGLEAGKVLEKEGKHNEAIKIYQKLQKTVERIYGTKSDEFKELVKLQSAARGEIKKKALTQPSLKKGMNRDLPLNSVAAVVREAQAARKPSGKGLQNFYAENSDLKEEVASPK